jgi:hypothetical protein
MSTLGVVGDAQGVGIVMSPMLLTDGLGYGLSTVVQEWSETEGGKLKLIAQHVINLTYRTVNARPDFYMGIPTCVGCLFLWFTFVHHHMVFLCFTFFGVMSSDNACLVRQPRVRVLKQIVASHRGFVSSLDGAPEGSLGSGPSSDSLAIADVENQDRMQFSIAVRMQINNI